MRPVFDDRGFTLVEVLVGLLVGTLVVGGVMGLVSLSLDYRRRVEAKRDVWPVLEEAAQEILVDPERFGEARVVLARHPDRPEVAVSWTLLESGGLASPGGLELYRVLLSSGGSALELELLGPALE